VSVLEIVLLVVLALVLLLAVGGAIATQRRTRASSAELHRQVQAADQDLATAHAQDKGWERATLEGAARQVLAERFGDAEIRDLHLVQIVDRPGTDSDQAVFRAETDQGEHVVTLGRTDGVWGAA
jgi:type VI protein secretion system component VasK